MVATPSTRNNKMYEKICKHFEITGSNRLDQLRQIEPEALCQFCYDTGFEFRPCIDGYIVTDDPRKTLKTYNYDDLDAIILGDTRDEGSMFHYSVGTASSIKAYTSFVPRRVPKQFFPEFEALYPPPTNQDELLQVGFQFWSDMVFQGPTDRLAQVLANRGKKIYRYRFNAPLSATADFGLGVHHAVDVPYMFGVEPAILTEDEKIVSETMQTYWISFANGDDLLWEPYGANRQWLVFGIDGVSMEQEGTDAEHARWALWDRIEQSEIK
jgi:para-nitrobenzyl esterase